MFIENQRPEGHPNRHPQPLKPCGTRLESVTTPYSVSESTVLQPLKAIKSYYSPILPPSSCLNVRT